jgi:rhamnulokinase
VPHPATYLALDLGTESGRAVVGAFDGATLHLDELHRFANRPVRLPDGLHSDTLRLWTEIKYGLRLALRRTDGRLASLGVDTWGADFGLLDAGGTLLFDPYNYRDRRTEGMLQEAFRRVPPADIYAQTGAQFLEFHSLYQLLSMVVARSPLLEVAHTLLLLPDLFNYWLAGRRDSEFSIATTSYCYDPHRGDWAWPLLEQMGVPGHLFTPLVMPGTRLGPLLAHVSEEVGDNRLQVVAVASHDTGSAVAAVPATLPRFGWISSGTWSIAGAEIDAPLVNARSMAYDVANEGGAGGTIRLCLNIMGLWLVQECRRVWAQAGDEMSYAQLTAQAAQARPFASLIDPDAAEFLSPETPGEVVRCALESLSLKYRWAFERLEALLSYRLEPIHIVGGGSQNGLLNQFTADALQRPVVTGPVEATAAGNIIVQAQALGHLTSLEEGRAVVRHSFPQCTYEPGRAAGWDEAYDRLLQLLEPAAASSIAQTLSGGTSS